MTQEYENVEGLLGATDPQSPVYCIYPRVYQASTRHFLDGFPGRNTLTSICQNDLSLGLLQIAELLTTVIGNPCLEGDLILDESGQPDCNVADVTTTTDGVQTQSLIPQCSTPSNAINEAPCWYLELNRAECSNPNHVTGLLMHVERGQSVPPVGTSVQVNCAAN